MSELIHGIAEVGAFRTDERPARLIVEVSGMASSAGWANVRLERQTCLSPPEDGVLECDLVGDRPAEGSADALTPVTADYEGEDEDWITGVRIHGAANEMEVDVIDDLEDEDDFGDEDGDAEADDAGAPSTAAAD